MHRCCNRISNHTFACYVFLRNSGHICSWQLLFSFWEGGFVSSIQLTQAVWPLHPERTAVSTVISAVLHWRPVTEAFPSASSWKPHVGVCTHEAPKQLQLMKSRFPKEDVLPSLAIIWYLLTANVVAHSQFVLWSWLWTMFLPILLYLNLWFCALFCLCSSFL